MKARAHTYVSGVIERMMYIHVCCSVAVNGVHMYKPDPLPLPPRNLRKVGQRGKHGNHDTQGRA
jgi:hypothetical protein